MNLPAHNCVVNHLRLVGQISVKLDCQQLNDMFESVFAVGSADGLILKPYLRCAVIDVDIDVVWITVSLILTNVEELLYHDR